LALLAAVFAALNMPNARAMDKIPRPTLSEMVDAAQAAATGRIIAVRTGSYVLQVDKMLRGQRVEQLEIQFSRYACMPRPFEYQVNQRLIVLLARDAQGRWQAALGPEAESLIEGDEVACSFRLPDPRAEFFGPPPASRVPLAELEGAITEYPDLFIVPPPKPLFRPRPTTQQTPLEFAKRSRVHRLLSAEALRLRNARK
jgi:hypothetical protein